MTWYKVPCLGKPYKTLFFVFLSGKVVPGGFAPRTPPFGRGRSQCTAILYNNYLRNKTIFPQNFATLPQNFAFFPQNFATFPQNFASFPQNFAFFPQNFSLNFFSKKFFSNFFTFSIPCNEYLRPSCKFFT